MARKRSDGRKMLPCHKCCPANPPRWPKAGIVAHVYDVQDWSAEEKLWGWRCDNCGHFKTPRAPRASAKLNWNDCTAEEAKKLNLAKLAKFHYFNDNGVRAEWKAFGDLILTAHQEGIVAGGFYYAYGPSGYHEEQLYKLASAKSSFKSFDLHYTVSSIREQIARGTERLEERLAEVGRTMADLQAIHNAKGTE